MTTTMVGQEQADEAARTLEQIMSRLPEEVENDDQAHAVNSIMDETRRRLKEVEALRKSFTEGLVVSKRRIDDRFKKPKEEGNMIIAVCKKLLISYKRKMAEAQEKAEAEERERRQAVESAARLEAEKKAETAKTLRDEFEAKDALEEVESKAKEPLVVKTVSTFKGDGRSLKVTYCAEVVDASKVPRSYMVPNMKLLNAMATDNKGENPPPGVIFGEKV